MNEYLLIMHTDVETQTVGRDWGIYLDKLKKSGQFVGGSTIGKGFSFKKNTISESISLWIGGYIVVNAATLEDAKALVAGNPVLMCGGTVEVRELPKT